jgi:hypothetical protein
MAAGISDVPPLRDDRSWSVSVKGHVYEKNRHPEPFIRVVTEEYFEAAGIPLRAGRLLTETDRVATTPVVVVNETMARTAWFGENPLGQTITTYGGQQVLGVVVVVADVRHEALEEASGRRSERDGDVFGVRQTGDYAAMQLVVRTGLPPGSVAEGIRAALLPIDPNLPVRDFQTLQDLVDKAVSPRRFLLLLLGGFAAFALILASLGIYAVIWAECRRCRCISLTVPCFWMCVDEVRRKACCVRSRIPTSANGLSCFFR